MLPVISRKVCAMTMVIYLGLTEGRRMSRSVELGADQEAYGRMLASALLSRTGHAPLGFSHGASLARRGTQIVGPSSSRAPRSREPAMMLQDVNIGTLNTLMLLAGQLEDLKKETGVRDYNTIVMEAAYPALGAIILGLVGGIGGYFFFTSGVDPEAYAQRAAQDAKEKDDDWEARVAEINAKSEAQKASGAIDGSDI